MSQNSRHVSQARFEEILRRQNPPRWSPAYEPAIKAVREEAPSISRAYQVWSYKLKRYMHAFSTAELKVLSLVHYHPALFELHEQRMLSIESSPHPLAQHPSSLGMELMGIRGTLNVCSRLDLIDRHPRFYMEDSTAYEKAVVPFPFIGDFLLFLLDKQGPYCINLTVKNSPDEFWRAGIGKPKRDSSKADAAVQARHVIEERYYLDAGIRTERVVERDIPDQLYSNLQYLIKTQGRIEPDEGLYAEMCDRLQASMQTNQTPMDIVVSLRHKYGVDMEQLKAYFALAIYSRQVLVEIMDEAIFLDRKLMPERNNPLVVFKRLFARGE